MELLLGIDVGSSSAKVGLFTFEGRLISMTSRVYATHEPQPGWKEQDAAAWWGAVTDAIHQIGSKNNLNQVQAIGCTGHICSHTFVDKAGNPLRPSLGFQDQRAITESEQLYSRMRREELTAELGIDLPPAATWPLPRLLWFQNHEPETLEKAYCLLHAKDFINFHLTGEFAADASSHRGLVNLKTGREAERVLSRLGLPRHLLPPLQNPEQVMGRVLKSASAVTGLPEGVPVVTGWNDLNASVLGSGAVNEGDAFDVTGSSEHVGMVTSRRPGAPQLMYAPFLPGKHLFYGMTLNGGGVLTWYCETFGRSIEEVTRLAESVPAGSEGLFFLPYLDGERAPVWDSRAAGAFVGIRSHHTQGHFGRAVLEGVAFSLLQIFELVEQEAGRLVTPIVVSGGAARIQLWNEIKTNIWGKPAVVPENVHTGFLGAAMLAAVATGRYASCETAAQGMVKIAEMPPVTRGLPDLYRKAYEQFCEIYPSLRSHFLQVFEDRVDIREPACQTRQP